MKIEDIRDEQDLCAFLADIDCRRHSVAEMTKLLEAASDKAREIMASQEGE